MEDEDVRILRREIREEFQTLGKFGSTNKESKKRYEAEFKSMDKISGERSVQVSKEFQALNEAFNVAQSHQGKSRLDYKDTDGNIRNLTKQVKNILGRAVYQSGKFWVDSQLQVLKPQKTVRIQFASKEYFELLRKKPEVVKFLALGQNIRFYFHDTSYEIYE